MARIPEEELERLKREVSLQRLVEARGVKLERRGKEWVGLCPFHEEQSPSFSVNPEKNVFRCFGCQASGSVIDWVMRTEGRSFRYAVELLRSGAYEPGCSGGTQLPPLLDPAAADQELWRQVIAYYHACLKERPEALAYLKKRGLDSAEALDHFQLGYADRTLGYRLPAKPTKEGAELRGRLQRLGILRPSGHECFRGSVVFPIFDAAGALVELYGRKIGSALRRGTPLHLYLAGPQRGVWNREALAASAEVILCEALIDALTFWCAGYRQVTAAYGVNGFTEEMLAAFVGHGVKRVLLAFDRDEAGDRGAAAVAERLLAQGIDCFRVLFPHGLDANEYALKVRPASESLGVLLRSAVWLGNGQRPAAGVAPARWAVGAVGPAPDGGAAEGAATATPSREAAEGKAAAPARGTAASGEAAAAAALRGEAAAEEAAAPAPAPPGNREAAAPAAPGPEAAEEEATAPAAAGSAAAVPGASVPAGPREAVPPSAASVPPAAAAAPPPAASPAATASVLPAAARLEVQAAVRGEEVVIALGDRRYRVRGLAQNLALGQLRVNLVAARAQAVFVDTVDLCKAKERAAYVRAAAAELGVPEGVVTKDLGLVFLKLEELQDQQLAAALQPQETRPALTDAEREAALALLQAPDLLDRLLADFERAGVVGERTNKLLGYLAAVSRKLAVPLTVIIQSSSAAGKTALMEAILAFVPEEERVKYSAMTGQSLFYMAETDLRHKVLAIVEEEGAEKASYALKLLQSEGELTIASTGKDPSTGRLVTHEYRVEGPVAIFLATTAIDLDEELDNRCVKLTVDEEREQTRAIHRRQRERRTLKGLLASEERAGILRRHRNAQRLLRPLRVVNPWAERLTFLDTRTRTRRDHEKYLTLIEASALLHQYQRPQKAAAVNGSQPVEYVEATLADVAIATELANEVLGRSLDDLPPQTRRFLGLVDALVTAECERLAVRRADYRFTRRRVSEAIGWSYRQVQVHLGRLEAQEYVVAHRNGGERLLYELLYDGRGQEGERFLMGLVDVAALRAAGMTGDLTGQEGDLTGEEGGIDRGLTPVLPAFSRGLTGGEVRPEARAEAASGAWGPNPPASTVLGPEADPPSSVAASRSRGPR